MSNAVRLLSIVVAVVLAATGAQARTAMTPGHGPPDVRDLYVCRVLARYGGGFCTSPPYAPVGKHCTCEGPRGPRPGAVEHR
jgi:hypothetical protein